MGIIPADVCGDAIIMRDFFEEEDDDDDDQNEIGGRVFDVQDLFGSDDKIAGDYAIGLNVNRLILESALRLLQGSFWWRFRSDASRMRLLQDTYHKLYLLVATELTEGELLSEQDLQDLGNEESEEE